jgi:hypothetical protein
MNDAIEKAKNDPAMAKHYQKDILEAMVAAVLNQPGRKAARAKILMQNDNA